MKKENAVKKEVKSNNGFTLIELLIVVLIIGILSAIALPGYRKAVEKSRVSDAITTMQAVAKSEHGWYINNNSYTKDFADLDIVISGTMNNGALATAFYTYELLDTGIIADRNNGEYSIYKDYENQEILCNPGTHYICQDLGAFTKVSCEKVGMAWANSNSTCYMDEEDRCKSINGDSAWNTSRNLCGYYNQSDSNYKTIGEGMSCQLQGDPPGACSRLTIKDGGKCVNNSFRSGGCNYANVNNGIIVCSNAQGYCGYQATFTNGSICVADSAAGGCGKSSYINHSICYANAERGCGTHDGIAASFDETSCCCGAYCPDSAPKCSDRGIECDPQYM